MNYAQFAEYVRSIEQELSERFGVPRSEAAEIAHYVEVAAISAEVEQRKEDQLILEFKRVGSQALAERHGVSPRTIRDWRTRALRRKTGSSNVA